MDPVTESFAQQDEYAHPHPPLGKAACTPFLKWPGGKRLLSRQICSLFPKLSGRYIEPFLGGGAIFFSIAPLVSLLSDIDGELINAYKQVRDNVECIIEHLSKAPISKDHYYNIRASRPLDPLDRSVRFLYLNRTAFNGIYRVNRNGEFNVPFGCKPGTKVCEPSLLRQASKVLASANLKHADFEEIMSFAETGDVVYADPPYTTKHDDNGFRRYNKNIFSWKDQIRLVRAAREAAKRGAVVFVSNAHHRDIRKLYEGFQAVTLTRPSCVSGRPSARGLVKEYLFIFST